MYEILKSLVLLMAPILAYTADEIWPYLPGHTEGSEVQIEEMPQIKPEWLDEALSEKWDKIIELRYDVTKALELARREKLINHSLTAKVDLYPDSEDSYNFLNNIEDLVDIFIVSDLVIHQPGEEAPAGAQEGENYKGLKIAVTTAPGKKCESVDV